MGKNRLQDKVALITGGANGIGEGLVHCFLAEGARVLIGDIDEQNGEKLAAALGDQAAFIKLDVTEEASFQNAIAFAVTKFGCLNVLVNNAAASLPVLPVQETSNEDFHRLVKTNLYSVFLGCKLAYPHLKQAKGCVLNVSSMAGILGQADHAIYAATKGGINALTKSTAVDWGKDRIRINAICPSAVWTPLLREWCDQQPNKDEIVEQLNRVHCMQYFPEPEEFAPIAAFLCSDEASFITGCLLPASGGIDCGYKL
jgi:NAD(P)-dependent dehydrogenase (short-subunit alcohol dehydrogenase family)